MYTKEIKKGRRKKRDVENYEQRGGTKVVQIRTRLATV